MRKENDSFTNKHFINKSHLTKERASAFTSKGSATLEATMVTTIFFFGVLCLIAMFEIMITQVKVKSALHAVAKEIMVEVCTKPVIPVTEMENKIAEKIGAEKLNQSLIVNGENGFDCSESKKYWNTTIMDLSVKYTIEIPTPMFRIPIITQKETIRVKGWTGHETKQVADTENKIVYVTDYGVVYHQDMNCTYLELSLKTCPLEQVEEMRNQSGGKYKECAKCKKDNKKGNVYITDYGDKYHFSLDCSKIKRSIYAVSVTDIKGMGGCSKCVE